LLDRSEVVRMHAEEGLTPREIAPRLGATAARIRVVLKEERALRKVRPLLHGRPLRKTWEAMHRRCEDATDLSYPHYGAKGARVGPEWAAFPAFYRWAIEEGYRPGLCLTRRRGARIYSPRTCSWATRAEVQQRAQHVDSALPPVWTVDAFGECKGPAAWSRDPQCQVTLSAILRRLRSGWPAEDAIATPPKSRGKRDVPTRTVTAFGTTKGLTDWSRDRRCKVSLAALRERLERGIPAEEALTTRPFRLGVPARARLPSGAQA
jgi:hypothetical protein